MLILLLNGLSFDNKFLFILFGVIGAVIDVVSIFIILTLTIAEHVVIHVVILGFEVARETNLSLGRGTT